MPEKTTPTANKVLRLYLDSPLEADYAHFLDLLIEKHAIPVIEKCLRAKFQESANKGFYLAEEDFEDLLNESCLKVLEKLSALRKLPNATPIRDFENYAAVVAYNCFNEFLQNGAPHWKSLKNKIRYAVGKNGDFEIWRDKDERFCGLVKNGRKVRKISIEDLINRVEEEFADFRNAALTDLLFEILEKENSAVQLNELVSIVAKLRAIEDLPNVSLESFGEHILAEKHTGQNDFEMRFDLAQIWQEIRQLPTNQRVALLFNLRDEMGREMLFMFFNTKIASLKEISEAMNLSLEECAEILPFLPLEDKLIAEKMDLSVKRVGDLRQIARRSLKRRLEGKPKRNKRTNDAKLTNEEENNGNILDPAFGEN